MSEVDPPGGSANTEEHLPSAWTFEARGISTFRLPRTARPWNWIELDNEEAIEVWRILKEFVSYLNLRYVERQEQRIPPCWAEHGALVEELATLFWARWHAFEGDEGTIGGAQFWHSYSFPMFLERMARWLGPDRLRKCQSGKHEASHLEDPEGFAEWQRRTNWIEERDIAQRKPPRPHAKKPRHKVPTSSEAESFQGPPDGGESPGPDGPSLHVVPNREQAAGEHDDDGEDGE